MRSRGPTSSTRGGRPAPVLVHAGADARHPPARRLAPRSGVRGDRRLPGDQRRRALRHLRPPSSAVTCPRRGVLGGGGLGRRSNAAVGVAGEAAGVGGRAPGRRSARASRRSRCAGSRRTPAAISASVVHHERAVLRDRLADRPALQHQHLDRPSAPAVTATGCVGSHHGAGARRRPSWSPTLQRRALEQVERAHRVGPRRGRQRPTSRRARARTVPDRDVGLGPATPTSCGGGGGGVGAAERAGDHRDLGGAAGVVGRTTPGDVVVPQHREVRVDQLVGGRAG